MAAFQSLSESEMEIMQVIWETATPVTTAYLLEVFAHKGWKGQTIATFLTRLADKGVLTVTRKTCPLYDAAGTTQYTTNNHEELIYAGVENSDLTLYGGFFYLNDGTLAFKLTSYEANY